MAQWVPPAGLMPSGAPNSCAQTGQISGFAGGRLFAPFDVDLDRLGDDGQALYGLPWIEAAFDPSLEVNPKIVCPGNDIDVTIKGGRTRLCPSVRGVVQTPRTDRLWSMAIRWIQP